MNEITNEIKISESELKHLKVDTINDFLRFLNNNMFSLRHDMIEITKGAAEYFKSQCL